MIELGKNVFFFPPQLLIYPNCEPGLERLCFEYSYVFLPESYNSTRSYTILKLQTPTKLSEGMALFNNDDSYFNNNIIRQQ